MEFIKLICELCIELDIVRPNTQDLDTLASNAARVDLLLCQTAQSQPTPEIRYELLYRFIVGCLCPDGI